MTPEPEPIEDPIEYIRCICRHPGDNPACPVDHDQIQHEQDC